MKIHCAHDAEVAIGDLKPNPANPNKHPDSQIALLAKIIKAQGWRNPIVISNRSGLITKGHGRLAAALTLGATHAPVDYQDYASEKEELADMIADNRIAELAEADRSMLRELAEQLDDGAFDMELTGFDQDALEELMTAAPPQSDIDAEPQIDKAEELRKKWGVERGQIWELGEHRIMCGDSLEDAPQLLNDDKADLIFTSPPYGVGLAYRSYKDTIDNLRGLIKQCAKVWPQLLVDGGFAVINFGDIVSASGIVGTKTPCEYPMALEYWPAFREFGWILWSRRIWCKPGARTGSMQCISSNRAATNWEHLWTWKTNGKPIIKHQTSNPFPSQLGWIDTSKDERPAIEKETHAGVMPVAPARWMIAIHSRPKSFVHEPFTGSGTTIIACEQMGRKCRAMEIDTGYVAVSIQRWADATGKTPKLLTSFPNQGKDAKISKSRKKA